MYLSGYLWICTKLHGSVVILVCRYESVVTYEYVLICSNLSGSVGIGVDLYESCVDLYEVAWFCVNSVSL